MKSSLTIQGSWCERHFFTFFLVKNIERNVLSMEKKNKLYLILALDQQ